MNPPLAVLVRSDAGRRRRGWRLATGRAATRSASLPFISAPIHFSSEQVTQCAPSPKARGGDYKHHRFLPPRAVVPCRCAALWGRLAANQDELGKQTQWEPENTDGAGGITQHMQLVTVTSYPGESKKLWWVTRLLFYKSHVTKKNHCILIISLKSWTFQLFSGDSVQ